MFLLSMCSKFIHVITCISTLFLFIPESYSIVGTYHILFVHSTANGHLSYFYFLAIMNKAMNIGYVLLRSAIAGLYRNSMFNF